MSILIPGMEMPTTCAKCPLGHINAKRYAIECYAEYPTKLFDYDLARHSTNPFCPLVPVPPHGRLIDADAAKELLKPVDSIRNYEPEWTWGELYESNRNAIDKLPTIIPAEPPKEEHT